MIDLLEGRALPGAKPPEAGRTLAGTLSAVVLAGALAFGGFVAHTAPSGLLGGATLGWPASPSRVADRPPEAPPAATGPTERAGGGRGKPVAVTSARATETVGPHRGTRTPSTTAVAAHDASRETASSVTRTADPSTPTHPRGSSSEVHTRVVPSSILSPPANRVTDLPTTGDSGRRTDPTHTSRPASATP